MNKRTMKKMAKAKQQAAEAAKTAETVVKTAAPAKEVKPTTEKTLHTEAAEGKAEAAKEPKKATKKETVKKTVKKETTETMAEATKTPRKMTKVSDTVLEIFETKVSMKDLEAVIKKEVKATVSGIYITAVKGEIKIYLNAEQRAAYYTVDGQGSDDFKVDLTTLAE